MSLIKNFTIAGDWVNLNSLAGITVGVAFSIQNRSRWGCDVQESPSEPTGDAEGFLLTPVDTANSIMYITDATDPVWVKSASYAKIAVQEV